LASVHASIGGIESSPPMTSGTVPRATMRRSVVGARSALSRPSPSVKGTSPQSTPERLAVEKRPA
jgi:hypothetical protein